MIVLSEAPALTAAQADVLGEVLTGLRAGLSGRAQKPHILYGITSSGKTEIYLAAADEALRAGRQVIILVPEIALTPQTVRRFMARFPGQVGLVHSRMSEGERYDTWRRARDGKLGVIVGPRSALFTPLPNLGLIVIDEFHDDSYYQNDLVPAYHAVSAAMALARLSGALVLLGSATPDVSLMERARLEGWPVLRLPARILAHTGAVKEQMARLGLPAPVLNAEGEGAALDLPEVRVIDMRQELKAGNRTIFSRALRAALEDVLAKQQQAILFLNRRGTATYVFCRECGSSLDCPRCNIPLTFHTSEGSEAGGGLVCHTCGYRRKMPAKCPKCGSAQIRQFGLGTEKVEAEVQAQFPGARTIRWDAETAREKDAHDLLLGHFTAHRADILIGTQMIAKGLDFPGVTLVGVLLADGSMHQPDFRAGERTFQLLAQVSGRAGRGELPGEVIVQTYTPSHPAVVAAETADFDTFAAAELAARQAGGFPPFAHLTCLTFRGVSEEKVAFVANTFAARLKTLAPAGVVLADATPSPRPKAKGAFRYQILLRAAAASAMRAPVRQVVADTKLPADVLLAIDVDAVSVQ